MEDFLRFQYSKGAQRAERAESAELPTEDVARMDPRNSGWEKEQGQPLLKKYVCRLVTADPGLTSGYFHSFRTPCMEHG